MDRREKEKQEKRKGGAKAWAEQQDRGWEPTSIKLPDGAKRFKLEQTGFVKIDIIPYICGSGNPSADKGETHFERTFFVHKGLGLDGKSSFICLEQTCKKKCPICEFVRNQGNQADPELIKNLRAQRRHLFNVYDCGHRDLGIQVWDAPSGTKKHPSFGALLANKIQAVESYENFYELTKAAGGLTLQLTVEKDGQYGNKVINIEMIPRVKDYNPGIIQKATCLDDCIMEMSYSELFKQLHPGDEDADTHHSESNGDVVNDDTVDDSPDAPANDDTVDTDTVADESGVANDDDNDQAETDNDTDTAADDSDTATTEDSDDPRSGDDADDEPAPADDDDSDDAPATPPTKQQAKTAAAKAPPKPQTPKPAAPPSVNPTKPESIGVFKIGMQVSHATHGKCEIVEIKGGKLTLEDKSGKEFAGIDPKAVKMPEAKKK